MELRKEMQEALNNCVQHTILLDKVEDVAKKYAEHFHLQKQDEIIDHIKNVLNPEYLNSELLWINVKNAVKLYFEKQTEGDSLPSIILEIEKFKNIHFNWDGYGGIPISTEVCENGITIINALKIKPKDFYPNPNGTLSLNYKNQQYGVYVEIGKDSFTYYSSKKIGGVIIHSEYSVSFSITNIKKLQTVVNIILN